MNRESGEIASHVFNADDIRRRRQLRQCFRTNFHAGPRRIVFEDERNADRIGDLAIVPVKPLLIGLVVIGRHDESRRRSSRLRRPRERDGLARAVRSGRRDNRNAARRRFDRYLNQAAPLLRKKRRRLPRDAANDQAFASLLDLPGDEVGERLLGDVVMFERRRQRCQRTRGSSVASWRRASGLCPPSANANPWRGSGTANRIAAATARLMEAFAMNYLQSLSGSFEHRTASARRPDSKAA